MPRDGTILRSVDLAVALEGEGRPDCLVVCTDHSGFDYERIARSGALIVDTRNALKAYDSPSIFRV